MTFPAFFYHKNCVKGKIFETERELYHAGEGWVDSPAKLHSSTEQAMPVELNTEVRRRGRPPKNIE